MNKKSVWLSVVLMFPILLMGYSNCSVNLRSPETASSSSGVPGAGGLFGDGTLCDQDLKVLYQTGYYQFARANCVLCHDTGPGKGRIASANINDAFYDFSQVGYAKVSDNAISSSHNPPYTGPQHVQTINQLRIEWQQGLTEYSKCSGTAPPEGQQNWEDLMSLQTSSKVVPKVNGADMNFGQSGTLTWSINTEISAITNSAVLPNLPGASFSIQIGKYKTAGGQPYYTFSQPRLASAGVDVLIKKLQVKVNGRLLNYPTTFRYVEMGIRAGSAMNNPASLISTGSLVAPGILSSQDQISVSFESIAQTVLPPPAPPVIVTFSGAPHRWTNASTDFVDVTLQLSRAPDAPATVTISADTTPICGNQSAFVDVNACDTALSTFICASAGCPSTRTLGRARSVVGTNYNRFDWDFRFNATSIVFGLGETQKTVRIFFSRDIRKENNRLFTLQIDANLVNAQRGPQSKINFVIDKMSNPTPPAGVPTFSQLMQSGGVLGFNCVKCHNSKDLNGGYDMTNYALMISRGVVIPNNANSLMFGRMNPSSPAYLFSSPMPIEGALPVEFRREVETWILNGAANN